MPFPQEPHESPPNKLVAFPYAPGYDDSRTGRDPDKKVYDDTDDRRVAADSSHRELARETSHDHDIGRIEKLLEDPRQSKRDRELQYFCGEPAVKHVDLTSHRILSRFSQAA